MRIRIKIARIMIRMANFFGSLPLMVMRPDDILEFVRDIYSRQHMIDNFAKQSTMDYGLDAIEDELLKKIPCNGGQLLLLGIGGGREAIPLARAGFQVTGVDFIPEMLERARQNLKRHNLDIKCQLQEFSKLDLPEDTYEVVWMSTHMYSAVPTRRRRIDMLKRIHKTLRPDGFFVCQSHLNSGYKLSKTVLILRRVVSWITLGNLSYEPGDILINHTDFLHEFLSEEELKEEFYNGGFETVYLMNEGNNSRRGSAILRKI